MKFLISCLSLLFITSCAHGIDLTTFEAKLNSDGVEGEIHGVNGDLGLFVFTYRNPQNFFDFIEMSLIPKDNVQGPQWKQIGRHDRVKIKGRILKNPSPQKHLEISSLEIVKKYSGDPAIPSYSYQAQIPDDLLKGDQALFLVHAVHADGKILVVEYKDAVVPIFVSKPELTKDLARNDLVRLSYRIQAEPDAPLHLKINDSAKNPVEVVESVMTMHGQKADMVGELVLFPKSPQVVFNVFALLQKLPGGLQRQYTLANFENPETFTKIRLKLQKAWDDAGANSWISGRNKLISTKIKVRAIGKFNEVDPNQANVQILLDSEDSITLVP